MSAMGCSMTAQVTGFLLPMWETFPAPDLGVWGSEPADPSLSARAHIRAHTHRHTHIFCFGIVQCCLCVYLGFCIATHRSLAYFPSFLLTALMAGERLMFWLIPSHPLPLIHCFRCAVTKEPRMRFMGCFENKIQSPRSCLGCVAVESAAWRVLVCRAASARSPVWCKSLPRGPRDVGR